MRFWSCLQSFVVLAATLAYASPTPTPQTAAGEAGVDATSGDAMSAAEAAKQELQQAAALLASMPTCGVSGLGRCLTVLIRR
jgi:hypothetical protein